MQSDLEGLEVVCQHYKRYYEHTEIKRLKNNARKMHRELLRLKCELLILRVLLKAWLGYHSLPPRESLPREGEIMQ